VPQVLKIVETKSTEDLSWSTMGMSGAGQVLWICHAFVEKDVILGLFCTLSLALNATVATLKYRYSSKVHAQKVLTLDAIVDTGGL